MGVYERLGMRPIINARGTNTRLGGAQMEQAAIEAMAEAAQEAVPWKSFRLLPVIL